MSSCVVIGEYQTSRSPLARDEDTFSHDEACIGALQIVFFDGVVGHCANSAITRSGRYSKAVRYLDAANLERLEERKGGVGRHVVVSWNMKLMLDNEYCPSQITFIYAFCSNLARG